MSDDKTVKVNNEIEDSKTPSVKQVFIVMALLLVCSFGFIFLVAYDDRKVVVLEDVEITELPVTVEINAPVMGDVISFADCKAYIETEGINTWDVELVLRDQSSMECFSIPTYRSASAVHFGGCDVSEESRRVFGANVDSKYLSLEDTDYDVLIYYNNNEHNAFVDTGRDLTREGLK